MARLIIFCSFIIYASSQNIGPCGTPACVRTIPQCVCPCPPQVTNPALGCLDPVITPYGTVAEMPVNLANILPPVSCMSLANPCLPSSTSLANPFLSPASPLSLANPFLSPASPLPLANSCLSPASPLSLANPFLPVASPMSLANPFLPAASPVSAYLPSLSPMLPPASPCNNRCQYLKKIPIPPPCI